ncbi:hypothetical protein HS088_TW19G00027 [Tripterygium wilfordii]|uniref:25S rRNA (uridine-N(3))-methyltransferase BMT5-like domain-containing protein n=1 Tax=Tripterygium wilfordii TaxID=458696 RepID=A0A7J7C8G7_TRIWF|nr:hypothetical protein HS088_TW19G00027 [Tripterygium wilfordii]
MEIGGLDGERCIGHYRSVDKILLVGEGDFSFALCLAKAFGSAGNMVATSLDSNAKLLEKYSKVAENLKQLRELGCKILHKVNAHSMSQNRKLNRELFDRIVFNFPHAGFRYAENWDQQIELHKQLVKGWNVKELAEEAGLELSNEVEFDKRSYPGYVNKRGDGSGSDRQFLVGESSTFMFRSVDNERCIGQYRSVDKVLLVGEGDFSFALCLAKAFGSARNMVATSLDSKAKLLQKYSKVAENLEKLGELGCTILHKVNAHSMSQNPNLNQELFDRIVFNFPHAGFRYAENWDAQIDEWNVKKLAKKVGLKLTDEVEFDKGSYPGYENKRGDGRRSDEAFPVGECTTFMFRLNPYHATNSKLMSLTL